MPMMVLLPGEHSRDARTAIHCVLAATRLATSGRSNHPGEGIDAAWPLGIDVSRERNALAVANYGSKAIRIFPRTPGGDVSPTRVIGGARTGIVGPVGVAFDRKNGEIWVANYGDHSAVVFDIDAAGNTEPKRIIRNAPAGTPTTGFTNASAAAYDSKRGEILVPIMRCRGSGVCQTGKRKRRSRPHHPLAGRNLSDMHGLAAPFTTKSLPVALSGATGLPRRRGRQRAAGSRDSDRAPG